MTYHIKWQGEAKPQYESQLRAELDELMDSELEGLITHTMMVEGAEFGTEGPSVSAHWDDDRACLVASYSDCTEWVSFNDIRSREARE